MSVATASSLPILTCRKSHPRFFGRQLVPGQSRRGGGLVKILGRSVEGFLFACSPWCRRRTPDLLVNPATAIGLRRCLRPGLAEHTMTAAIHPSRCRLSISSMSGIIRPRQFANACDRRGASFQVDASAELVAEPRPASRLRICRPTSEIHG
jgi:hypothetical protein